MWSDKTNQRRSWMRTSLCSPSLKMSNRVFAKKAILVFLRPFCVFYGHLVYVYCGRLVHFFLLWYVMYIKKNLVNLEGSPPYFRWAKCDLSSWFRTDLWGHRPHIWCCQNLVFQQCSFFIVLREHNIRLRQCDQNLADREIFTTLKFCFKFGQIQIHT
jgi:hypothetical protein